MSGESHRAEKVGERVRIELTDMLARGEIHDPAVSGCIVSAVQVTRDLSLARVFVRLLSADPKEAERKRLVAALDRASGFVRRTLAARLSLRRAPELRFAWDDTADRGRRIDELLHEIAEDERRPPKSGER